MYILLILVALASPARAGWWSNFCERYLVTDDIYQFEQTPRDWLSAEVERLEIKRRWGTLDSKDAPILSIMRSEIKRREMLDSIIKNANDNP